MESVRYLSKVPLIFEHKDIIYSKLTTLLNKCADAAEEKPFEFDSSTNHQTCYEDNRKAYDLLSFYKSDSTLKKLLDIWVQTYCGRLLEEHKDLTLDGTYRALRKFDSLRLAIRMRFFCDTYPYILGPHKDSADTLLACILQLSNENPKTNFFIRHKKILTATNKTKTIKPHDLLVSQFIKQLTNTSDLHIAHFKFNPKLYEAWVDKVNSVFLIDINDEQKVQALRYDTVSYEYQENALLCFNNPLDNYAFETRYTNYIKSNFAHGLKPQKFSKRRLLLIDVIQATADKTGLVSWRKDKNEILFKLDANDSRLLLVKSGIQPC